MTDDVAISHLQRRKIEGGVLIPFIETCREKFGDEATRDLVGTTIERLAAQDGARWAESFGRDLGSLKQVAEDVWAGGGSLEVEVLEQTDETFDFNVTRCRYAEFYQELGLADIGAQVHCARDFAMLKGFNPDLELERTQTLMGGGSCCDFRFRAKPDAEA